MQPPVLMEIAHPLKTNGLAMPPDFPTRQYNAIFERVCLRATPSDEVHEQFSGAWNALAYRFLAMTEYEQVFASLVTTTAPGPKERYEQERALFGFFSSGFSVFESTFYGLFVVGASLSPGRFAIATAKDRQKITPTSTAANFNSVFTSDPLNSVMSEFLGNAQYLEWREIRNVLTHRAAPGRTFFVSIGGADDEPLPDQWKIKGIVLDNKMARGRRVQLADILSTFLNGIEEFLQRNL